MVSKYLTPFTSGMVVLLLVSFGLIHVNTLQAQDSTSEKNVFGELEYFRGDLTGYIFWLDKNTKKIPSFSDKKPVGQIYTKELNIPNTKFDKGFPGISDRFEWFAIVFNGKLFSPKEQTVKFRVASDDGSKLYINRKLVIDNDGLHAIKSKEGTVKLKRGWNEMHLEYFQGPRHYIALQLYYTPPSGEEKTFSMDDFATPEKFGDPNRPPSLGGPVPPPKTKKGKGTRGSSGSSDSSGKGDRGSRNSSDGKGSRSRGSSSSSDSSGKGSRGTSSNSKKSKSGKSDDGSTKGRGKGSQAESSKGKGSRGNSTNTRSRSRG